MRHLPPQTAVDFDTIVEAAPSPPSADGPIPTLWPLDLAALLATFMVSGSSFATPQ